MRTLLTVTILLTSPQGLVRAADAKGGKVVYEKHCKSCHGPNGAPPANVAKFENGRITDLRASRIQSLSSSDLEKIVQQGKGKMRGDTTVNGHELDDLVAYVHELK